MANTSGASHASAWAIATVFVWATLAPLGVSVQHLPPFFITGCGLIVGGLLAVPTLIRSGHWRIAPGTAALGIYGLFGYHALLFAALQWAPPTAANLVNYLWPMGIVVMAPLFVANLTFTWGHALAAVVGFAGSALAIVGNHALEWPDARAMTGYGFAFAGAIIWSTYSLLSKRRSHVPTASIGAMCLLAGSLSLLMHVWLEPSVSPTLRDWGLLALLGLGPVGGSFFMWDKALKSGDARQAGLWAFFTPVMSTALLALQSGTALSANIAIATLLIVASAVIGRWAGHRAGDAAGSPTAAQRRPHSFNE
jgi:drug/metabolite transporter (DMT)-like permease